MQPLKFIVVLCLLAGTAFGQQRATIIIEAATDSVSMIDNNDVQFGQPAGKDRFVFHLTGEFPRQISFRAPRPQRARLMIAVDAGDSVHVANAFTEPVFSGNGAAHARAYDHTFKQQFASWNAINDDSVKAGTATDLYRAFEKMFQQSFDYIAAHRKEFSASFYKYIYNTNYYRALNYKVSTPFWYRNITGKPLSQSIPDNYWKLRWKMRIDQRLWKYDDYRECMLNAFTDFMVYEYKFSTGMPDGFFNDQEIAMVRYRKIEKYYAGKVRTEALHHILEGALGQAKDASVHKPVVDEFISRYADQKMTASLNEIYARTAKLAKGKRPDAFTLKDIDGNNVMLSDFAGKVVYLDFWASWCGPCRAQMKEGAPKLHKVFKDRKDLVFLYINMDEQNALAKQAIDEDRIEGTHLFSGGIGNENAVSKAFNIQGIPRYIIIGRDGKIIDNDAPRPTEPATEAALKEALQL